mmetsp:Transcript_18755/g.44836  ORF Transcript_18755/g.44836 Transcript_18755/m.44836 type:complete len:254 (-) Transcript_18755:642-1403(-)
MAGRRERGEGGRGDADAAEGGSHGAVGRLAVAVVGGRRLGVELLPGLVLWGGPRRVGEVVHEHPDNDGDVAGDAAHRHRVPEEEDRQEGREGSLDDAEDLEHGRADHLRHLHLHPVDQEGRGDVEQEHRRQPRVAVEVGVVDDVGEVRGPLHGRRHRQQEDGDRDADVPEEVDAVHFLLLALQENLLDYRLERPENGGRDSQRETDRVPGGFPFCCHQCTHDDHQQRQRIQPGTTPLPHDEASKQGSEHRSGG